jgi:hypothetical protein
MKAKAGSIGEGDIVSVELMDGSLLEDVEIIQCGTQLGGCWQFQDKQGFKFVVRQFVTIMQTVDQVLAQKVSETDAEFANRIRRETMPVAELSDG